MVVLIKAVGVLILTAGIVFFIYPQAAKKLFSFFRQGRRIYIAGVLRILFGVIFLMGASDCRTVGVITTLGILLLVAGILIFVIKLDKIKSVLEFWHAKPNSVLRFITLVPIAIGALILYSA